MIILTASSVFMVSNITVFLPLNRVELGGILSNKKKIASILYTLLLILELNLMVLLPSKSISGISLGCSPHALIAVLMFYADAWLWMSYIHTQS